MRASIRPRRTTAKAASWPLISGSLVGNKFSWFDGSFTLDEVLDSQEGSSLISEVVRYRRASDPNELRVKIAPILKLRQVKADASRMQPEMVSKMVMLDIGTSLSQKTESFDTNTIGLIGVGYLTRIRVSFNQEFPRISRFQIVSFVILQRDYMRAFWANITLRLVRTQIAPVRKGNLFMDRTKRREASIPHDSKTRFKFSSVR